MNPIAIWCKFESYRDWCYLYRIPKKEEFVEDFKYEYADFIKTIFKKEEKIIETFWGTYIVGYKDEIWNYKENKHVLNNLDAYLEAGFLRVRKKADERLIEINNKNMKLFYFEVKQHKLDEKTNKYSGEIINTSQYKYIIAEGETAKEVYDLLRNSLIIRDGEFNETQGRLKIINDNGYEITSGGHEITKEVYNELTENLDKIFIDSSAVLSFSEMWPSSNIKNILISRGLLQGKSVEVLNKEINFKGIIHPISKYTLNKTSIRPKLSIFSNLLDKVEIVHTTIVDTINKYVSRLDPKTNVWKPVVKSEIKQLPKSEKRLVCIATKDKKVYQRIPHNEAEILIKNHPEYEFISKEEYRKLQRPKPGVSFTATLTDYNENGIAMYKKHTKLPSNPSSSKKAKCLRKSNHCKQGISGKKVFNTYTVSFFRNMKEGNAEFVYTEVAPNEWKAISRASKKAKAEGTDLAYYSPKVELSIKSDINTKVKGESSYKRIILPLVTDLPERKDKKGKLIPWMVKKVKVNTETNKFEVVKEEVKTFTGYQITYQKIENPFKKSPKKWKHPIKGERNKVKIIKSKSDKTIIIKKKQ